MALSRHFTKVFGFFCALGIDIMLSKLLAFDPYRSWRIELTRHAVGLLCFFASDFIVCVFSPLYPSPLALTALAFLAAWAISWRIYKAGLLLAFGTLAIAIIIQTVKWERRRLF
ncbi:membrane protein of unknown function (plasmid) [Pararobbsia alpina]